MIKQEIVYRNSQGVLVNAVFDSFQKASSLIDALDRANISYDWYELRNGKWVEASSVTVMHDEDGDSISAYIVGQAA